MMNLKTITIAAILLSGLIGGYLYNQQNPTDQAAKTETMSRLPQQPILEHSPNAQSFSADDLNSLRRQKTGGGK
jgi:hypothetical protein